MPLRTAHLPSLARFWRTAQLRVRAAQPADGKEWLMHATCVATVERVLELLPQLDRLKRDAGASRQPSQICMFTRVFRSQRGRGSRRSDRARITRIKEGRLASKHLAYAAVLL